MMIFIEIEEDRKFNLGYNFQVFCIPFQNFIDMRSLVLIQAKALATKSELADDRLLVYAGSE